MTKTQEELAQLKTEFDKLNGKLKELSEDELKEVTGGVVWDIAVKLKEKFNSGLLGSTQNNDMLSSVDARGKNGKPTLPLWDETSGGFIDDPDDSN